MRAATDVIEKVLGAVLCLVIPLFPLTVFHTELRESDPLTL
jgi:hypothetical protein